MSAQALLADMHQTLGCQTIEEYTRWASQRKILLKEAVDFIENWSIDVLHHFRHRIDDHLQENLLQKMLVVEFAVLFIKKPISDTVHGTPLTFMFPKVILTRRYSPLRVLYF